MIEYLGKKVIVHVDRPKGSLHPSHNFLYPINYGFIPSTIAPDGEEIDAYILFENEPLESYEGTVIAVIHRYDDIEDKLVVSNQNTNKEEIFKQTYFQEQYFHSEIIMDN